jgi:hypothetical protein
MCLEIIGFIVVPFIWSIPEALVTAELGAAFQDPSAGVAWYFGLGFWCYWCVIFVTV